MIPPRVVSSGPVLENIWRDDEVDICKFPAPFVHELDGGRYISTEDLVVMRDPDTGWINATGQGLFCGDACCDLYGIEAFSSPSTRASSTTGFCERCNGV